MTNNPGGIRSVTIELLRTGTPHNQTLSPGITYLALCGSHPPAEFRIDLEQYKYNQYLKLLRYKDSSQDSRMLALDSLQKIITEIFEKITALLIEGSFTGGWLHVRLVITPKELSMLPFELALTPCGFQGSYEKPFLLNPQRLTTLTREVRQVASKSYNWPFKVRILFAWAQPANAVPHQDHFDKLAEALTPWARPFKDIPEPVPDISTLITEVQNAGLASIQKELEKGINDKRPYTHVHILAHGVGSTDENGERFSLALQKPGLKEADAVDGFQLASALILVQGNQTYTPAVVTITACDSSNSGSPVLPGGSLAYALHHSGIPCVFASQFPLTKEGSVKLVTCLYPRLLNGEDPRTALYYTREALNSPQVHDWASLVAYARFPDDIDEQLEEVKLKMMLEAMKITNSYADHVLKNEDKISPEKRSEKFNEIKSRLDRSIDELETLLEQLTPKSSNPLRLAEHFGLIGSAYKRKAEYLFRISSLKGDKAELQIKESALAIKTAHTWYREAFELLPSNHWVGGQYLSLTGLLKGTLVNDVEIWLMVKFMAKQALKDPKTKMWALGTLMELYLLKPLTVSDDRFEVVKNGALASAKKYLSNLMEYGDPFAKESTIRQLERYIEWWPRARQSPQLNKLKDIATELRKDLPALDDIS